MTQSPIHPACRPAARVRALLLVAVIAGAMPAGAQLIPVRTLPVAEGDQFAFFPSANFGLGASIAVPDTLHDPFVNPAKGSRISRSYFFGAPTAFSVSRKAGSGSTLPAGVITRKGDVFAGAAVAIQSVTDGREPSVGFIGGAIDRIAFDVVPPGGGFEGDGNSGESHSNRYGFLMAGRTFAASKISVGASALWSGLGAMDGVSLRYPFSRDVQQSGGVADLRFGALKEWSAGHSLEALLLYQRVGMSHDVTYSDSYWDPIQHFVVQRARLEHERDEARTRGIHVAYQRPLADSTWRIGAIVTANLLRQPHTPRYEIGSVPSDEGRATAFNLGVGLARTQSGTTYAVDAVYEPIIARLWGIADSAEASGGTVIEGERTLENRLRYANALVRAGVSHDFTLERKDTGVRLQLGLQARSMYYTLGQHDLLREARRTGGESWMEWSRSWGASVRLPAIEFHYRGSLTTGASRPAVQSRSVPIAIAETLSSSIAQFPSPPIMTTMSRVSVTSHQLSISLPIR